MKNKAGIVVLIILCAVLAITLFVRHKQAVDQKTKDAETILTLSNKWAKTSDDLGEQRQVNVLLTNDIAAVKKEIADWTNRFAEASATLEKTQASLKTAQEEVAKRDTKIADLETRNQSLDKEALELSTAITNLNAQIADTQKKLATAEGDKAFLQGELKRLKAERDELEHKFYDLAVLRAQVKKLKDELAISRRLDWIRKGLFADTEQKGAQKLVTRIKPPPAEGPPHYDLNVEVGSDGSVRVIPPLTNRPATSPPPAK